MSSKDPINRFPEVSRYHPSDMWIYPRTADTHGDFGLSAVCFLCNRISADTFSNHLCSDFLGLHVLEFTCFLREQIHVELRRSTYWGDVK